MRSLLSSFICVLTLLCASQAMAASAVYTVELYVDVTSANASQAREKALTEANRKALETVAAKITTAMPSTIRAALPFFFPCFMGFSFLSVQSRCRTRSSTSW